MKRIIDINDELFRKVEDQINHGYLGSDVWIAVAESVPYDDSGDLISRSALEKEIFGPGSYDAYEDLYDAVRTAINNAPAVEARPQGKWIAREDMDYIDENKVVHNHFMCNKCGLIHDFIDGHTSQYNFCPNCGADKRGGAEL